MAEKVILKKSSVNIYWKTQDPRMLKVLNLMETAEPWVVDDVDSVARELVNFGKRLGNARATHLSSNSDEITIVLTYISSGKAMRIMNWLDDNFPGLSFFYVMEARSKEDWDPGRLLLDRLKTIKTLSLLGSLFSPMRANLIINFLEDDEPEE